MRNLRNITRTLASAAAVATALAVAACSADSVAAPDLAPGAPSLAKSAKGKKVARPARGTKPVETRTFVYDPTKKLIQPFGTSDQVTLPAGAVCDPATSGYGVALWDAACKPLTKPITFTVSWTEDAAGHTIVEFSPDVRFVPGAAVTLELNDRVKPKDRETGTIYWCPTGSSTCVDEGEDDSSVRTTTRGTSFHYERRLKHFSGYTVIVGLDESSELQ